MRTIFTILVLLLLEACSVGGATVRATDPPFKPVPPPNAPQEYQQGWIDGCETGFGAHGNDVYRWEYPFKQNPSLVMNQMYYKAWKDAENYCRTYAAEYTQRALTPWCSFDGITDDCSDVTHYNSMPFIGQSTENYYGVFGGAGVGSALGGGDRGMGGLMGNNDDGISDVLGWGALPDMQGTF